MLDFELYCYGRNFLKKELYLFIYSLILEVIF